MVRYLKVISFHYTKEARLSLTNRDVQFSITAQMSPFSCNNLECSPYSF